MQQLLRYFDSYNSMPIENLLSCPTVIELNAIENENDKAAIMCYLLYAIFAYVNSNMTAHSEKEQKLENFIFIEEAHVLLDTQREVAEGQANPAAEAKKLILRMLKELRSIGVGVGLADQSPKSVGNDVVAMTLLPIKNNDAQRPTPIANPVVFGLLIYSVINFKFPSYTNKIKNNIIISPTK